MTKFEGCSSWLEDAQLLFRIFHRNLFVNLAGRGGSGAEKVLQTNVWKVRKIRKFSFEKSLFAIGFPYKNCNLPTRQDGRENHDEVYQKRETSKF